MIVVITLAWVFGVWMLGSWGLMLFVGNLHNWWMFIPPMGFDTAMGVVLPLMFILGPVLFSRYSSNSN